MNTESTKTQEKKIETLEEAAMTVLMEAKADVWDQNLLKKIRRNMEVAILADRCIKYLNALGTVISDRQSAQKVYAELGEIRTQHEEAAYAMDENLAAKVDHTLRNSMDFTDGMGDNDNSYYTGDIDNKLLNHIEPEDNFDPPEALEKEYGG